MRYQFPLDSAPSPERRVFPVGNWQQKHKVPWHIADAGLAVGLLVAVVALGNLDSMPQGLGAFLEIRLSVKNLLLLAAFGAAWPLVMMGCGLYSTNRMRTGRGEWPRLVMAGAIGCLLAMAFPLTSRSGLTTPGLILLFGLALVPAAGMLRFSARAVKRWRHNGRPRQVVLVGSGRLATQLYWRLRWDPDQSFTVLGFVDSEPHAALAGTGLVHLGATADLERILMHRAVDDVVIGLPVKSRFEEIRQSLSACARLGIPVSYSTDIFTDGAHHSASAAHGAPVVSLSSMPEPVLLVLKRVIDLVGAAVLLVVLAPLMLGVAMAIKVTSRGPILYSQDRYGYMKRLFRMYKFRTMVVDAEQRQVDLERQNEASGPAFKMSCDPRVTRLGGILRRTSLDELPQLWHVLTGDMSLVGPRPMATRDVRLFPEPWLMRRFSMPPGLTCLWQIGGRSSINFDQWIALDLQYIDNWSLWLDLTILLRTLPAVVRGTGAM